MVLTTRSRIPVAPKRPSRGRFDLGYHLSVGYYRKVSSEATLPGRHGVCWRPLLRRTGLVAEYPHGFLKIPRRQKKLWSLQVFLPLHCSQPSDNHFAKSCKPAKKWIYTAVHAGHLIGYFLVCITHRIYVCIYNFLSPFKCETYLFYTRIKYVPRSKHSTSVTKPICYCCIRRYLILVLRSIHNI